MDGQTRERRIIPAYAGSTPGVSFRGVSFTDHPRIRGEHVEPSEMLTAQNGSSPHTRGALLHGGQAVRQTGIIPAYAGSTRCRRRPRVRCRDHPRIRGEHFRQRILVGAGHGSSPHTRGARDAVDRVGDEDRIIPAYAGSTSRARQDLRNEQDHPRIRGEHASFQMALRAARGSSPHTRGALAPPVVRVAEGGIIPAYAGSTPSDVRRHDPGHGSSPHTRGARDDPPQERAGRRIIPAYAGSTGLIYPGRKRCKDHPRIRGEHRADRLACAHEQGSSPHTRGALR